MLPSRVTTTTTQSLLSFTSMDTFVCNSCFAQLSDFRFKCICCVDYDVCQSVRRKTNSDSTRSSLVAQILVVQCMDRVVQDHEDHVFLKIRVEPEDTEGGRAELSLAEELTVLDAIQVFDLGK